MVLSSMQEDGCMDKIGWLPHYLANYRTFSRCPVSTTCNVRRPFEDSLVTMVRLPSGCVVRYMYIVTDY